MTITVLSVQQPWAYLIIEGFKPVENRTWSTEVRGDVHIHASKTFDQRGYAWVANNFPGEFPLPSPESDVFRRGGIIGVAELCGCVNGRAEALRALGENGCRWFSGPYGHVFKRPLALPFVPCHGQLGYFTLPGEVLTP